VGLAGFFECNLIPECIRVTTQKKIIMAKKFNKPVEQPTHEEIAARAYSIFEERGRPHGRDLEHWFEAEAQLAADRPERPAAAIRGAPASAVDRETATTAHRTSSRRTPRSSARL
jgi:hypothetical protein